MFRLLPGFQSPSADDTDFEWCALLCGTRPEEFSVFSVPGGNAREIRARNKRLLGGSGDQKYLRRKPSANLSTPSSASLRSFQRKRTPSNFRSPYLQQNVRPCGANHQRVKVPYQEISVCLDS
jgi:hypothetical protein